MAMVDDRRPLRVLQHAARAGDRRLAKLLPRRLFPDAAPAAWRTLLLLLQRFGI
jgi:hypothetical protein